MAGCVRNLYLTGVSASVPSMSFSLVSAAASVEVLLLTDGHMPLPVLGKLRGSAAQPLCWSGKSAALDATEGWLRLLATARGEGTANGVRAMLFQICCKPLVCSVSDGCVAVEHLLPLPVMASPALSVIRSTPFCWLPNLLELDAVDS